MNACCLQCCRAVKWVLLLLLLLLPLLLLLGLPPLGRRGWQRRRRRALIQRVQCRVGGSTQLQQVPQELALQRGPLLRAPSLPACTQLKNMALGTAFS